MYFTLCVIQCRTSLVSLFKVMISGAMKRNATDLLCGDHKIVQYAEIWQDYLTVETMF